MMLKDILKILVIISVVASTNGLQVFSVEPSIGTRGGGTVLTINGIGFERRSGTCRFGRVVGEVTVTKVTSATFIESDRVSCESPEWLEEACTDLGCETALTVSNDEVNFSGGPLGFGGSYAEFIVLNSAPRLGASAEWLTEYSWNAVVDQYTEGTVGWVALPVGSVAGQGFTTGTSGALAMVQVQLRNTGGSVDTVTVHIREGTSSLHTESLSVAAGFSGWLGVNTTASDVLMYQGGEYNIALECGGSCSIEWAYANNTYARGTSYAQSGLSQAMVDDASKDYGFETQSRGVVSTYETLARPGQAMHEALDLSGPSLPLLGPRTGRTAITIRGENFQNSPELRCHTVLLAVAAHSPSWSTAQDTQGSIAQTFVPDRTGFLHKVDIPLQLKSGTTWATLRVTHADVNDTIATQSIYINASTVYDQWTEVVFDTPPQLSSGSQYFLVLEPSFGVPLLWGKSNTDTYASGQAYAAGSAVPTADMAFKAYIETTAEDGNHGPGIPSIPRWVSDSEVVCETAPNEAAAEHPYAIIRVSNDMAVLGSGYVPFHYSLCNEGEPALLDATHTPGVTSELLIGQGAAAAVGQSFTALKDGDLVRVDMHVVVSATPGSLVRLSIGESPAMTGSVPSEQEISFSGGTNEVVKLFLHEAVSMRAGQQYWVAMKHISGSQVKIKWNPTSAYSGGHAYEQATAGGSWTQSGTGDLSFSAYACHGCVLDSQPIMSSDGAIIGTPVPSTIYGEPYTEEARSAAAQSFTAQRTGLIHTVEIGLRIPSSGNVYGRSLLCMWVSTGDVQGSWLGTDVDDGNVCRNVTAGTEGFVGFTFDRPVYVVKGTKYFLTVRHGNWYSQTTKFAAIPNTVPMQSLGGMEDALSPTAIATWLGATGNPYWPQSRDLPGEAATRAPGEAASWIVQRDMDLSFRYSICSTGFPYVLNLTTGFDHITEVAKWPHGCCTARASPRHGSLLILTGANFFPSDGGLRCVFYFANGTAGPTTVARPLNTEFTRAQCATPVEFDPFSNVDCTAQGSCLGVFVSITNDGYNYAPMEGVPLATLGAKTRKLLLSDIFVSPDGHDYLGDGTASRPYSSLQRAIRAANQRDRIYIVSGSVLLGDGNRELKHLGKDILIWTTPGTTVTIDCEDMGLAVLAEDQQARWSQIYPQSSVSEGTRGEIQSSADVRYRRCKRSPTITLPE